jgi:AcrR family transcriptional regulator
VTESDPPLGLRERKKLETRQALVAAAIRLAIDRGIDHVTVDDIAAAAGVSARTFFNYFPSKEDAILRPDADPMAAPRQVAAAIAAAPAGLDPLRMLQLAWRPVIERLDREAEDWLARISIVQKDPKLIGTMFTAMAETEQLVVGAIAERLGLDPRIDFYPRLVFHVTGAAFQAATGRWYELGGKESVADLFDVAIEAIAAGLPVPPARLKNPEGEK